MPVITRLRLGSGLIMLVYVTMHLLNHAVGLVSVAAMEAVLRAVATLWGSLPGHILLYGSFLVHYLLALWTVWQRRSLRLRAPELAQIVLGFALPILLLRHVIMTRVSGSFFDTQVGYYTYILWVFFVRSPDHGLLQLAVLVIAWTHAMIGLHFWLKVRPWYARFRSAALITAVLVPVLSLLGTIEAGRRVAEMTTKPGWLGEAFARMTLPTPEIDAALDRINLILTGVFVAAIVGVLAARVLRRLWQRRHGVIRIGYPNGRFVEILRGTSVLEASRVARIPHASVCGGRGRCSTCRVRVRAELPGITPPGETEQRVLRRIGATSNVRLACQLRPNVSVEVTPLLPPFAHAADGLSRVDFAQGSEREIAILFADIRGFTALSEGRLPYDVVFILNRYFAAMGRAIESAGGRVDKFVGDGVMALFGITSDPGAGCRDALAAVRLMAERLDELNQSLRGELEAPLRIGIGIHAGAAIVGEMGFGGTVAITAIGDAVNTASRLQEMTKGFECELIVSERVISRAGHELTAFHWHEVEIRGRQQRLAVTLLDDIRDLPEPASFERQAAGASA